MTYGMFKDRLEAFKQDLLVYRNLYKNRNRPSRGGLEVLECSKLEACREKLLQQFKNMDEYVTRLSLGRYRIHLNPGEPHDIYLRIFLEESPESSIDDVLSDLEDMLRMIETRSPQECIKTNRPEPQPKTSEPGSLLGLLGHQGHTQASYAPDTFQSLLGGVATVIQRKVENPEDRKKLQAHLQAVVNHPGMTPLLPLPLSVLL